MSPETTTPTTETVTPEPKPLSPKQAAKLAKRMLKAKIRAGVTLFRMRKAGLIHDHTEACEAKNEGKDKKECSCPKATDPNEGRYVFEHGKSEGKYYVNPLRAQKKNATA